MGTIVLLIEEILYQLRLVVFYPIIPRVLYIPGGCLGFLPSTLAPAIPLNPSIPTALLDSVAGLGRHGLGRITGGSPGNDWMIGWLSKEEKNRDVCFLPFNPPRSTHVKFKILRLGSHQFGHMFFLVYVLHPTQWFLIKKNHQKFYLVQAAHVLRQMHEAKLEFLGDKSRHKSSWAFLYLFMCCRWHGNGIGYNMV